MPTPLAILTADIHIRSQKPACRTDDFFDDQIKKLNFIIDKSNEYNVPIIVAGDLGHHSIWGDKLLSVIIPIFLRCKNGVYVVPGQHDLPYHRIENYQKSALGVLQSASAITVLLENNPSINDLHKLLLYVFPYGEEMVNPSSKSIDGVKMAVTHQMVVQDKLLWDGQTGASKAKNLLKKFDEYDIILSGDNHKMFVSEYQGRTLVNPGSMMRTTIAQIDDTPSVFLLTDDKKVTQIPLPIRDDAFLDIYIDGYLSDDDKNERLDAYVERLESNVELTLSFEENLTNYIHSNNIEKEVEAIIWENVE